MNQKVKDFLENEYYHPIRNYVKDRPIRCVRAGLDCICICTLMVSWIYYVMKPFLDDANNYGGSTLHYDPIAVLGICGFVFLSFFFLMTWGWFYISKSLKRGFRSLESKYDKPLVTSQTESQDSNREKEK